MEVGAPGVAPCYHGTVITRSGPDTDGNGSLSAGEVTSTEISCGDHTVNAPRSSLVAVSRQEGATTVPHYVKTLVDTYARTGEALGGRFPLPNADTDTVRTIPGLEAKVVVSWLDALSDDPDGPRSGGNADFSAYFGDGWDSDWQGSVVGSAPQFNGDPESGWIWVNHEYISNAFPREGLAPNGQALSLALHLLNRGVYDFDVTDHTQWTRERADSYIDYAKQNVGGTWFRVDRAASGEWDLVPSSDAKAYDATSNTLLTLTGFTPAGPDVDDNGVALPTGVVAGIAVNCSGGQTPWGTIITAEENVQNLYGDLEDCWGSSLQFDPTTGFGPGANITFDLEPRGGFRKRDSRLNHSRDVYGFLSEIDVGVATDRAYRSAASGGDGVGHRKIGAFGRARWENATIRVNRDWRLVNGQPVVLYAGNDRNGGRIYKWVSKRSFRVGMTRAEVRALLDDGAVHVAHFEDLDNRTGYTLVPASGSTCAAADLSASWARYRPEVYSRGCESPTQDNPGSGSWIELSTTGTDIAPNAGALGRPGMTVGAALKDVNWNHIGGFPDDNSVLAALFTASMKIGIRELNRPEDIEWNPVNDTLYVAFTNHVRPTALDAHGVLKNGGSGGIAGEDRRRDYSGSIFAIREDDSDRPHASDGFTFWIAWERNWRIPDETDVFETGSPDNLLIDQDGGVWFGTDGQFRPGERTDGLYYLDLDPRHREGRAGIRVPTFGLAFRVVSGPGDSEATGPAFNSDMTTIFFNVQHPGADYEQHPSTFPQR